MKNKLLITLIAVFGVFLILDTPLLAQSAESTKQAEEKAKQAEERAVQAERESSSSISRTSRSSRSSGTSRIYVSPDTDLEYVSGGDYSFAYSTGSSVEKNSKLTLSKKFSGQSADKSGTFSIDEGSEKIRISISGRVEVGKITLALFLPDKKELTKLTIDDSADVSWSQSINIKEGDKKYFGDWSFTVKAESVEGSYHLSISTY